MFGADPRHITLRRVLCRLVCYVVLIGLRLPNYHSSCRSQRCLPAGVMRSITQYQNISDRLTLPTIVATIVSFVVAYSTVAWLLKFIANNSYMVFIVYRLILGGALILLLATGTIGLT